MSRKSQYRGVSWNPVKGSRQGPWRAMVYTRPHGIYVGRYHTEIEAARARDAVARIVLGERAVLNEVEG